MQKIMATGKMSSKSREVVMVLNAVTTASLSMSATLDLKTPSSGMKAEEVDWIDSLSDQEIPLVHVVTADDSGTIFLWNVCIDYCELVSKFNLGHLLGTQEQLEVNSLELVPQINAIVLTTTSGRLLFISSKLEVKELSFAADFSQKLNRITCMTIFEAFSQPYIAIGFSSGSFVIEPVMRLLSNPITNHMLGQTRYLEGAVNYIKFIELADMIAIGTDQGEFIMTNNFSKKEAYQALIFGPTE